MNMRIQRSPIVLAIFVIIISIIKQNEAIRINLLDDQKGGVVWEKNVNTLLLLSSLQWGRVSPPSPNPTTNASPGGNGKTTPSVIGQNTVISLDPLPPPSPPRKVKGL